MREKVLLFISMILFLTGCGGLNTAEIQVLDPSGNILCQRKHGFYMTPGATEGPGLILLGVAIDSTGACIPSNIDLPAGTTIAFQNQDYVSDRTVTMNSSALTIGPIGKATHITQPVTAEVYQSVNQLFNTQGTFTYDSGFGAPGRVLVYGLPTLTSVTPDKDSTNGNTPVFFTLTGTNFGTSQTSVNGSVKFIQVNESDPNNPWGTVYTVSTISSWGNTSIAGTVSLPAGKYRIEVTVRGENTTETVYFYKGTGNYQVIVGDTEPKMILITGTGIDANSIPFQMGRDPSVGDGGSIPVHPVKLSNFYMSKYDVTNAQYHFFDNSKPVDDKPVALSWYNAVSYCNWLSDQHGLDRCYDGSYNMDRTKNGYRLPTEAEWEYACRGGTTTDYFWGENYPSSNIGNYVWYNENSGGQLQPVGQKLPNSFGLYDMQGNIWEWCNDWHDSYVSGEQINPVGPSSSPSSRKIVRGRDCLGTDLQEFFSAQRGAYYRNGTFPGFRPVRTQ